MKLREKNLFYRKQVMSHQKMAQEVNLEQLFFTKDEILKNVEKREHIFEVRDSKENYYGHAFLGDLKNYIAINGNELEDWQVKNIDANEWTELFSHPTFQRRKPQLVSINTLEPESDLEFYILLAGQKQGPFSKNELVSMLDLKEILLTDMVSFNKGHTWMKLFQVENFERRTLKKSDELPGIPKQVIARPNEIVKTFPPETEALLGLGYLSNIKKGKIIEREKVDFFNTDTSFKTKSNAIYKWFFLFSFLGILFFLYQIKNHLASPFQSEALQLGEQRSPLLTPVETPDLMPPQTRPSARNQLGEKNERARINNQGRFNDNFRAKPINPIKPMLRKKSFMETSQYQEIKKTDAGPEEDSSYYYDNSSPMELDPVRTQVSKENYDDNAAPADPNAPIPSNDNLFQNEFSN